MDMFHIFRCIRISLSIQFPFSGKCYNILLPFSEKTFIISHMSETSRKDKAAGRILILCTALLWGLTGVCVKSISWGAMSIIAVRSIISLFMLFAVKRSFRLRFTKTNLLAAVMMSATSILYVMAIKLTTAGTAIVLQYMAPILVFLFSVFFRKRKPWPMEIVLTVCVFAGCVLSFADGLDFTHILGNVLAIASSFTYAAQIILMSGKDCDTQDCTIISNGICFLVCLPFLFTDTLVFDLRNIVWLLILSVFQYGLANILFSVGIRKIDPVEASLLLCIEPVFNPIPVAIFCGEHMGTTAVIGSAVVIISVALYGILPTLRKKFHPDLNS